MNDGGSFLFVGGPVDGQWRVLKEKQYSVYFAVAPQIKFPTVYDDSDTVEIDREYVEYTIREFSFYDKEKVFEKKYLRLYAPKKMTDMEVFVKLLEGYSPKKEDVCPK